MLASQLTDVKRGTSPSHGGERDSHPGIVVSFFLHLLVALLFVHQLNSGQVPVASPSAIPVDLVLLSEETGSPPQQRIARIPQQMKSALPRPNAAQKPTPEATRPTPPEGVAPQKKQTPPDALDAKLQELALLRQPDTGAKNAFDSAGLSNLSATSKGARLGALATYSVKDYVRAQVERRWNLDLSILHGRDFVIAIHVQMKRDGTITEAAIVDTQRTAADALYRTVALSARNAVLLSSPVALPAGRYSDTMDLILELNPRDVVR
jgi:hypothetical protein